MPIPLEKILTVSASEYCQSVGKELKEYELKGVHLETGKEVLFQKEFAQIVPSDAEVVVGYQMGIEAAGGLLARYTALYGSGTALIPRKE